MEVTLQEAEHLLGGVLSATDKPDGIPMFSVVIPSYNGAAWLRRSVSSAFSFSPLLAEVLVVDDGSTDDTLSVLSGLKSAYPTLRVISQSNGGLSAARNCGIAHAVGKYIVLLDSDDELIPCDLSYEVSMGFDAIRIGVEEVRIDGACIDYVEEFGPRSGKDYMVERFAAERFHTPSWAWVYKREFLMTSGLSFVHGLIHEDMLFTVEALLAARSVVGTPRKTYRYFKRDGSITMSVDEHRLYNRVRSLASIAQKLTDHANANIDVNIGWWALHVMDYAVGLAATAPSFRIRLCLLAMECRFFWNYRIWGRYWEFRSLRYRLPLAAKFLVLRKRR
jgi:glycosyltransferase involved in cell wall biosynthesis